MPPVPSLTTMRPGLYDDVTVTSDDLLLPVTITDPGDGAPPTPPISAAEVFVTEIVRVCYTIRQRVTTQATTEEAMHRGGDGVTVGDGMKGVVVRALIAGRTNTSRLGTLYVEKHNLQSFFIFMAVAAIVVVVVSLVIFVPQLLDKYAVPFRKKRNEKLQEKEKHRALDSTIAWDEDSDPDQCTPRRSKPNSDTAPNHTQKKPPKPPPRVIRSATRLHKIFHACCGFRDRANSSQKSILYLIESLHGQSKVGDNTSTSAQSVAPRQQSLRTDFADAQTIDSVSFPDGYSQQSQIENQEQEQSHQEYDVHQHILQNESEIIQHTASTSRNTQLDQTGVYNDKDSSDIQCLPVEQLHQVPLQNGFIPQASSSLFHQNKLLQGHHRTSSQSHNVEPELKVVSPIIHHHPNSDSDIDLDFKDHKDHSSPYITPHRTNAPAHLDYHAMAKGKSTVRHNIDSITDKRRKRSQSDTGETKTDAEPNYTRQNVKSNEIKTDANAEPRFSKQSVKSKRKIFSDRYTFRDNVARRLDQVKRKRKYRRRRQSSSCELISVQNQRGAQDSIDIGVENVAYDLSRAESQNGHRKSKMASSRDIFSTQDTVETSLEPLDDAVFDQGSNLDTLYISEMDTDMNTEMDTGMDTEIYTEMNTGLSMGAGHHRDHSSRYTSVTKPKHGPAKMFTTMDTQLKTSINDRTVDDNPNVIPHTTPSTTSHTVVDTELHNTEVGTVKDTKGQSTHLGRQNSRAGNVQQTVHVSGASLHQEQLVETGSKRPEVELVVMPLEMLDEKPEGPNYQLESSL